MKSAPAPNSLQPSKFFLTCLGSLAVKNGARALDVGCGYGRHTSLLAFAGYGVIALDYDLKALTSLTQSITDPKTVLAVQCDLEHGIPIQPGSADLVIAIEYPDLRYLGAMTALVAPGGHFLLETFTARGNNWRALPLAGSVHRFLESEFDIVSVNEKPAGPPAEARVIVKVFARRRWQARHC